MTTTGLLHAIDFGTSNSAIVVTAPDGTQTEIRDPAAPVTSASFPTVICVDRQGTVLAGAKARNVKRSFPAAFRAEFKRDFGDPTPTLLGTLSMTADEMAVHMLRFLRERAQAAVPGNPERVVVTVPVTWEAKRRGLMRDVLARAGYAGAAIDLVPEPVAAMAYAFRDGAAAPGGRITTLVYDLGGGTFDCAVARGESGWYEVLGEPGGIDDVGGGAFDRLLLAKIFRDEAVAATGGAPPANQPDDEAAILRRLDLLDACEHIKWELSEHEEYVDLLTELSPPRLITVTRAEFEQLIKTLIEETIRECGLLLGRLNLTWDDVDRVVPVGGSSLIPLVGRLLAQAGHVAVLKIDDPDLAVVRGAALLGRAILLDTAPRRVFVNGRPKIVDAGHVGFEQVVKLAFQNPPTGANVIFTVTYNRAPGARPQGSLTDGQSIAIQDGTIFNVTATDKS